MFDLDGVLVDSEHLWEQGWSRVASAHGYQWTDADTAACQGMSVPEWAGYLGDRAQHPATQVADDVVEGIVAAYRAGTVSLLRGARELVETVAALVPVALASSAARPIIDVVLESMDLRRFFGATVSSAEVERGKPSPDVYTEAIRRLGIVSAGSFAVEDSSNGVRAAAAAGLNVIAVPTDRYPLDADASSRALRVAADREQVRIELLRALGGDRLAGSDTRRSP